MSRFFTKRVIFNVGVYCFAVMIVSGLAGPNSKTLQGYKQGLIYYENKETNKAIPILKASLEKEFSKPVTGELQKAVEVIKSGNVDEAKKLLIPLLDDEKTAARARYELGLIYENKGKLENAAAMFYQSQIMVADKEASYIGVNTCKKCHFMEYLSWKKTKMAHSFEILKPGVSSQVKIKFNLDPKKDYTKDVRCLQCHTTGFGMPGGYKIPKKGDLESVKHAKENQGTACEACHGPGSKYMDVHKEIMNKRRTYTFDELHRAGQHKVDINSCTVCHNKRNPTAAEDYHFDYKKQKSKDTHKNFPLRYRKTK